MQEPEKEENKNIWGIKEYITHSLFFTATIALGTFAIITGVESGLAIVSLAAEVGRASPVFNKIRNTKIGKVAGYIHNILFMKPVMRVLKIAIPVIFMTLAGIATAGVVPIVALTASVGSMIYNIAKEVKELRYVKKLAQMARAADSINLSKHTANKAINILQKHGLDIQEDKIATHASKDKDEHQDSIKKTFLHSLKNKLIEGAGSVSRAFLEGNVVEKVLTSLILFSGASKDVKEKLSSDKAKNEMVHKIESQCGSVPKSRVELLAESNARSKRAEAFVTLAKEANEKQLSLDIIKESYAKIEQNFQKSLAKKLEPKSFLQKTRELARDLLEIHNPHISDPRKIFEAEHQPESDAARLCLNLDKEHLIEKTKNETIIHQLQNVAIKNTKDLPNRKRRRDDDGPEEDIKQNVKQKSEKEIHALKHHETLPTECPVTKKQESLKLSK